MPAERPRECAPADRCRPGEPPDRGDAAASASPEETARSPGSSSSDGSNVIAGAIRRIELEREIAERQRQAESARLDVRLFQRPVIEEHAPLFLVRQALQVGDFTRREKAARHVVRELAVDVLDVDADLAADRHRARDQAVGMRNVEAQVRHAGRPIENLRAAVRVGDELPVRRRNRRVARQRGADQRAGQQEGAPIAIEHEPRHARVLVLRQQRAVRVELRQRLGVRRLHAGRREPR